MAEWLKAHAWKACLGETLTWVRIPVSPPAPGLSTALATTPSGPHCQCPTSTITHTTEANNNAEPAYSGATTFQNTNAANPEKGFLMPSANVNGAIKCQQISGGDGYGTIADGTQTYLFAFGPLPGLTNIANGQPGTEFPDVFNVPYGGTLVPGDSATSGLTNYMFSTTRRSKLFLIPRRKGSGSPFPRSKK